MSDLENFYSITNWLSNLGPSSREVQLNLFKEFIKWVRVNGGDYAEYSPDELIEHQKNLSKRDGYELLDKLVKPYVRNKPGTYNSKNSRYTSIRSFFLHNRAELPRDSNFRFRPEREPIQGLLTAHEIRLVIQSCNPMYQAIFTCMFQSAMDQKSLTHWSTHGWDSLHAQLEGNQTLVKIELPGRKKNRNIKPYYTFIGPDAIGKLRNYLKHRAHAVEQGKISKKDKHIFINERGDPIKTRALRGYWLKRLRELGIIEPIERGTKASKTGRGLHEMRDVFKSLWEKSPASGTVSEYCLGHAIDPLEYNKSFRDVEYYRGEYKKALPYLQLLSRGEPFNRVEVTELDRVKRENRELRESMMQTEDTTTQLETAIQALMKRIENLEKERAS